MSDEQQDDQGPRSPGPRVLSAQGTDRPLPVAEAVLGGGPLRRHAEGQARDEQVEKDLDALLADAQRERDEYLDLAKRTQG